MHYSAMPVLFPQQVQLDPAKGLLQSCSPMGTLACTFKYEGSELGANCLQVAQGVALEVVDRLVKLQSRRAEVPANVLFPFYSSPVERSQLEAPRTAVAV